MDTQIVTIPLFDVNMAVQSYLFRYRQGNDLFSTTQATNVFDGASHSVALETLNLVGLDAFTLGKPLFVPITAIHLLGDLANHCSAPPENVIFRLDDENPKWEEPFISKVAELRAKGFRLAANNLKDPAKHSAFLNQCSYCFLSQEPVHESESERIRSELRKSFPHLELVATHLDTPEKLARMKRCGYTLFESRFYSIPVSEGEHKVSPLKANSIRLLNAVQDENFDFDEVSKIVQGDPALTISLMRIVNAPTARGVRRDKIKTIQHAVAMLGQQEVRKWVTTAVAQLLGDDKPNELSKISLVRAKFAENLAPLFEQSQMSQGLFLMGLFSVIDVILEVPMEEAFKVVLLSDVIRSALVEHSGIYYPVLQLLISYEHADWAAVSRLMIVHDIAEDDLSNAYIEALVWYRNLIVLDEETEMLESQ